MKLLILLAVLLFLAFETKAKLIPQDSTSEKLILRLTQYISKKTGLHDTDSRKLGLFLIKRNAVVRQCMKDSGRYNASCHVLKNTTEMQMRNELGEKIYKAYKKTENKPNPEPWYRKADSTARERRLAYQR